MPQANRQVARVCQGKNEKSSLEVSLTPYLSEQIIKTLQKIVNFMFKSTYAMEHFNYERTQLDIARGLEKPGKTRFAGVYWSAASVRRGYPALAAIVDNDDLDINIKVSDSLLTRSE